MDATQISAFLVGAFSALVACYLASGIRNRVKETPNQRERKVLLDAVDRLGASALVLVYALPDGVVAWKSFSNWPDLAEKTRRIGESGCAILREKPPAHPPQQKGALRE